MPTAEPLNTLLPLLVTRLIDRPDDCTETSPPPVVTWICSNESKLKYAGEEFDDRSVIDPPSRFHCTFAPRAARRQADLLARGRAADVEAGLHARRHVDDLPGVARRRDVLEDVRRERRAGRGLLRVDDRRRRRDRDFFRHRADFQLLIDAGVEAGRRSRRSAATAFLKLASSNVTVNVPIGTLGNW